MNNAAKLAGRVEISAWADAVEFSKWTVGEVSM